MTLEIGLKVIHVLLLFYTCINYESTQMYKDDFDNFLLESNGSLCVACFGNASCVGNTRASEPTTDFVDLNIYLICNYIELSIGSFKCHPK